MTRKERPPIIEKSDLAYQEFMDDDRVRVAMEKIIQATWDQAINMAVMMLQSKGNDSGVETVRKLRRQK